MAEITDEELVELRRAKEEREAFAKERDQFKAETEAAVARYNRDMSEVAEYFKANPPNRANPPAPEPEDDNAIISRKDLNAAIERTREATRKEMGESVGLTLKMQREANRRTAGALEYYGEFKDEIEKAIDGLVPQLAAHPDTYREVHNIVVARHLKEVREIDAKRAAARTAADAGEEIDDEGELDRPPPRPKRAESVIPAGNARPVTVRRKRDAPQLTAEEDAARARFGLSPEDYRKFSDLGPEDIDIFGFKGRSVV